MGARRCPTAFLLSSALFNASLLREGDHEVVEGVTPSDAYGASVDTPSPLSASLTSPHTVGSDLPEGGIEEKAKRETLAGGVQKTSLLALDIFLLFY